MNRKNDIYYRDPLGVMADATTGVVGDATDDDLPQVVDAVTHSAVSALSDLADQFPARRTEIAVQIRLHVMELKELVETWRQEAQERRPRGPERP